MMKMKKYYIFIIIMSYQFIILFLSSKVLLLNDFGKDKDIKLFYFFKIFLLLISY